MRRSTGLLRLVVVGGFVMSVAAIAHAQNGGTVVVGGGVAGAGKVTKSADRPTGFSAPIPQGLIAARKVFLSNGGADAGLFPHPFTGTQDRAYGAAYKALSADSRYTLVGTPAEADVVMFLQLKSPASSAGGDKKLGTEDALPLFSLVIYDRPTNYVLWTMSQTIDKANLQKTHDKNFDNALDLLLKQLSMVMSGTIPTPPAPPPVPKDE